MKVTYISNYHEGTGYSQAALDYILAMDAAGIDVVPRRLRLTNKELPVPSCISELEKKSIKGSDIVIQHTLPQFMEYCGGVKNIGLFAYETNTIKYTGWLKRLNLMDGIWVINTDMENYYYHDGFNKIPKVIPHTFNVQEIQNKDHKILEGLQQFKDSGTFLFYTISEYSTRKNFPALLKAFLLEFNEHENVKLVIKTYRDGLTQEEVSDLIKQLIENIKSGYRLRRKLANCVIIADYISPAEIDNIHYTCDCFVQPSYGEAWSIPAFTAMCFGKPPIVTGWSGYGDYISDKEGWLVKYKLENCFATDSLPNLYTNKEKWAEASVDSLRKCMREAFSNKAKFEEKSQACLEEVKRFDYSVVGPMIKKALDEQLS